MKSIQLSFEKIQHLSRALYLSSGVEFETTLKALEVETERFWYLKELGEDER
jgi:hypothetical protein